MIKNIVEKNNSITIDSVHKHKLNEVISIFKDSNDNFDLENFIKYLNDENVKVIREGYSLNFLGKRAAELQSALDSTTVFVPDKEHNSIPENKDSENIYISADNLEALRHLKKSYHNKIKCIYIDPPYNTGNDGFCYTDKFKYDKDELATKLGIDVTEAERILNMESTKSNSHSAWLSFMYSRLLISYELLKKDGVLFISIDKNEFSNLKSLCDDIFNEQNCIGLISVINNLKGRSDDNFFATCNEFLLCYAKNIEKCKIKGFKLEDEELDSDYDLQDSISEYKLIGFRKTGTGWQRENRPYMFYPVLYKDKLFSSIPDEEFKLLYNEVTKMFNDNEINNINKKYEKLGYIVTWPLTENGEYGRWRWGRETFFLNKDINLEYNSANTLCTKMRAILDDGSIRMKTSKTLWYKPEYDTGTGSNIISKLFDSNKELFSNPKSLYFISDIFKICLDDDDMVLDYFSGSSTSAHTILYNNAMLKKNTKYIMVQLPENLDENLLTASTEGKIIIKNQIEICDHCGYPHTLDYVGIERIKRAAKKIKDETNANIDYGFKHYTLIDKKDTLDTLEKFDSNFAVLTQDDILNEFSIESRLITFLCDDGFGLNAKYVEIDIAGYKCFLIDGFLYLLDKGFDSSQIASLIEIVDKKEIALRKIVIFGYAFDTRSLQQLKDNAEKLGLIDNKDIIVKY